MHASIPIMNMKNEEQPVGTLYENARLPPPGASIPINLMKRKEGGTLYEECTPGEITIYMKLDGTRYTNTMGMDNSITIQQLAVNGLLI